MAYSKAHLLDKDYALIADIAKALSHPARIKILYVLLEKPRCVCGDIVDELPLSQSTVSQHLKELKRVGLIDGAIEGPRTCYCINGAKLKQAQEKFMQLFQRLLKCC